MEATMASNAKTTDQPATDPAEASQAAIGAPETANRTPRPGSQLAMVVDLLESEAGATIAEMMAATGWQQHTVRGALAGSITKKLGRTVTSEKIEGRGRVYRSGAKAG
jgi:Protein of unknown function (DUF3489)